MKKIKTVIAAVMAAAMVLTMTACEEESLNSGSVPGGNSGASIDSTPKTDSTESTDSGIISAVSQVVDKLEHPELKPTKRIKWLAWYPISETTAAAELYKIAYGIPTEGDNDGYEGRIFEYYSTNYGIRLDNLSNLIAGGDSPDLYPFEVADFPYGVLKNRYQSVEDLFDFNNEKWAASKELMDKFMVNGKHYAAFWEITLSQLLWYRESSIKSIGAEDPQELFAQGKWDWDVFIDMSRRWQQTGTEAEPKWAIDGFMVEDNFIISTGVPMISSDGVNLTNNLHDPAVERAMTNLVSVFQNENLRYPRHELSSTWQPSYREWGNGNTLFFADGTWRYSEDWLKMKKRYGWSDSEIKVVPYPKDPAADKHYVQVKQDAYMWVKGSENKDGVQAWIDCCATAANDAAVTEASKQASIANPAQGWTAELLDFLNPLYKLDGTSPVTPIVELKTGLGPSVYDSQKGDTPVAVLTMIPWTTGDRSYTELRDENETAIKSALDELNALLKSQ